MSDEGENFDTVVIGSGFGGSIMSYRLAEAGFSVCVLERGKRYPPGSFPRSPNGYHQNFWDPSQGAHGLFNVWSFGGVWAVVSSGVGGGSLIYANVLLRKDESWFVRDGHRGGVYEYWPIGYGELERHYGEVEKMMGATPYPLSEPPYAPTRRAHEFRAAAEQAGFSTFLPNLAITFGNDPRRPRPAELIIEQHPNLYGANNRFTCRMCGECDVGCNYGSKNTLDFTYLTAAHRLGAQIRDRHEVRLIRRNPASKRGYLVEYVVHRPEREGVETDTHALELRRMTAERVVLSAGTLGSTYLLLKSAPELGLDNPTLGTRFCGNGDFLSFVSRARDGAGGARPLHPSFGPVITTAARAPDQDRSGTGRGFYVQDAGYPEWVNWVIESLALRQNTRRLSSFGWALLKNQLLGEPDADLSAELAALLGTGHHSASSMPLLGMGHDSPDGVLSLVRGKSGRRYLALDWRDERSRSYFERVRAASQRIARAMGGSYRENLLSKIFNNMVTVHPLGGCPMGRNAHEGTVDPWGEVFGCEGLYVADGSVMPGPVGANPSLTIAAVSNRFADRVVERFREERTIKREPCALAAAPVGGGCERGGLS